jgi:hypothetical protein
MCWIQLCVRMPHALTGQGGVFMGALLYAWGTTGAAVGFCQAVQPAWLVVWLQGSA